MKASKYLMNQDEVLLNFHIGKKERDKLVYSCQYEKRHDRLCATMALEVLFIP